MKGAILGALVCGAIGMSADIELDGVIAWAVGGAIGGLYAQVMCP